MNAESDALLTSFGTRVIFLHNGKFSVQTFFVTRKSLDGHAKTPVSNFTVDEDNQIPRST